MESENNTSTIVIGSIIGLVILWSIFSGNSTSSSGYGENYDSYSEEESMSLYDAKLDYWDDISEYLDGTYTIEACSDSSGNCYDVDADISSGDIDTIYFSNGGYLDIYGADVDYDGEASGDSDDDYWTFQVDEDDIDEAVEEWASYQDYTLE